MSTTTDPRARVALVTGGALGIGRAVAERLAADGLVVAVGHHNHPADDTVDRVADAGGSAIAVELDVTDSASVDAAMATVMAACGRLDILVNNAGGLLARVPIADMTDEHWERVLSLNLGGAFRTTRAAIPHLAPGGRIVNVSSLAAEHGGGPGASAYAAAKAGLIGFTRATAKELGPRGITVNAIAPGFIDGTPFHATFSTPEAQQAMITGAAVGRAGDPGDVANLVAYLASPEAGFVTGTVIDINGGTYFT
jgi:3-oxoacyl-[acyl-carrier protein] reductase